MMSSSVVYLSPVANSDDDNCAAIFVEDYAPVADPKPRTFTALQSLHIACPACCKLRQPPINATADVCSQLNPLSSARGREDNMLHEEISRIAIIKSRVFMRREILPLRAHDARRAAE